MKQHIDPETFKYLPRPKTQLKNDALISETEDAIIQDEARRLVDEATEAAESADYPDTDNFHEHVYSS